MCKLTSQTARARGEGLAEQPRLAKPSVDLRTSETSSDERRAYALPYRAKLYDSGASDGAWRYRISLIFTHPTDSSAPQRFASLAHAAPQEMPQGSSVRVGQTPPVRGTAPERIGIPHFFSNERTGKAPPALWRSSHLRARIHRHRGTTRRARDTTWRFDACMW